MKKAKPMPSIETILESLQPDFETGALTWKIRPRSHFPSDRECKRWNTRHAGNRAGNVTKHGHLQFKLSGQMLYVHRVMWKLHHKAEPVGLVQHDDGDSSNNRPGNLIDDNHTINMRNRKLGKNNTTGFRCVYRKKNRFHTNITDGGRRIHLGSFTTEEEAAAAYQAKRLELYGSAVPPCEMQQ